MGLLNNICTGENVEQRTSPIDFELKVGVLRMGRQRCESAGIGRSNTGRVRNWLGKLGESLGMSQVEPMCVISFLLAALFVGNGLLCST